MSNDLTISLLPASIQAVFIGMQGPAGAAGAAGAAGPDYTPPVRSVAGTTDSPTLADHNGLIAYTANSPVTVTVNDLGANKTYTIQQQGTGQVSLVAGEGVTLASGSEGTSFQTPRRYSALTINCLGNGVVTVLGDML